jgi:DNA-binding transcriptional LysR family regulator
VPGSGRCYLRPVKVSSLDLNLLVVLDTLLEEGSVTAAARRLNLSVPATSRALGRLRASFGDPLLVRAGRGLQPTAAALALRPRIRALVGDAQALLESGAEAGAGSLSRSFALLVPDDLVTVFGTLLLDRIRSEAPGVRIRFLTEGRHADEAAALRDGAADAAVVVSARREPDLRAEGLVRARMVGVQRAACPQAGLPVTAAAFAAREHVLVSRTGRLSSTLDAALAERGLRRTVAASAPTFVSALRLVGRSDLVAVAPAAVVDALREEFALSAFELPLAVRPLRVSQLWHPRHETDLAQQWLRGCVRETARALPDPAGPTERAAAVIPAPRP